MVPAGCRGRGGPSAARWHAGCAARADRRTNRRAVEGALAADLADLAFDVGRLAERVSMVGPGAVQRLAQAEAASLSWWTGDRISTDRLALWLSCRIGAAEEDGGGLIRTAWAARRLTAKGQGADLAVLLVGSLGKRAVMMMR